MNATGADTFRSRDAAWTLNATETTTIFTPEYRFAMVALLIMQLLAAGILLMMEKKEPRTNVVIPTKEWTIAGAYTVSDRRALAHSERAIVDETPDIDATVPLYVRAAGGRTFWRYRTGAHWIYPTQAAVNKNRVPE